MTDVEKALENHFSLHDVGMIMDLLIKYKRIEPKYFSEHGEGGFDDFINGVNKWIYQLLIINQILILYVIGVTLMSKDLLKNKIENFLATNPSEEDGELFYINQVLPYDKRSIEEIIWTQ